MEETDKPPGLALTLGKLWAAVIKVRKRRMSEMAVYLLTMPGQDRVEILAGEDGLPLQ